MNKLTSLILVLALLLAGTAFAEENFMPMPEAAAVYEGTWVCDRASIEIVWEEEGFRVAIAWGSSAFENTEWEYSCFYHEEDNTLVAMPTGSRTEFTYDDNGEVKSFSVVYDDGEATFSLDENGFLIWNDAKEGAGKDMLFERVENPEAE